MDYSELVTAIDRLVSALGSKEYSYFAECVSTGIATVGSVLAVVIFEIIKVRFFDRRTEFKNLKRKVACALQLYACYYVNQVDRAKAEKSVIDDYNQAAWKVRETSVELTVFAEQLKTKKCCGVLREDIEKAASLLMGLSNNFFIPDNSPEMREGRENYETKNKILKLLNIKSRNK